MSEVKLEKCTVSKKGEPQYTESLVDQAPLSWKDLVNSGATYQVTFDMLDDLINPLHEAYSIKRNMTRKLHYRLTDCSFFVANYLEDSNQFTRHDYSAGRST